MILFWNNKLIYFNKREFKKANFFNFDSDFKILNTILKKYVNKIFKTGNKTLCI